MPHFAHATLGQCSYPRLTRSLSAVETLGLWLRRDRPEVLFPRISLAILVLEVVVLVVGRLAWGWFNLLIGLLFPIAVMGIDAVISRKTS